MPRIKKKGAIKFARQNYTGLQSQFNIFFFIQFVSPLPLICLNIEFFKMEFCWWWGWGFTLIS